MKEPGKEFYRILLAVILATLIFCQTSLGQAMDEMEKTQVAKTDDSDSISSGNTLREIIVTASRIPRDSQTEPSAIYVLDSSVGTLNNAKRTTANILDGLPSVMIQKTSYGQTSPYLRGFTGYRTLCMIDGIRLNNSGFRSGPNQYWNTIDPLSIGQYELVLGPGSVLYGSDAIGGVLNALTLNPPDWTGKSTWERHLYYRGAEAERSNIGRAQLGARIAKEFGFVGGYSLKSFGDLKGGNDVGLQKHTGYDEQDFDAKVRYYINENSNLTICHQTVRQEDAWRTHRTIYGIDWEGLARGTDKVNSYDQQRDLTYLRYYAEKLDGFVNGIEVTLSRHAQGEDLHRIKKDDKIELQGFDLTALGATLQIESETALGQWVYGLDYYRDIVDSYGRQYKANGTLDKIEIQGPLADDAYYDLAGFFLQDNITIFNDKLDVIPGIRYIFAAAEANRVKDPITGNLTTISDEWHAVAGSLRMLLPLTQNRRNALYCDVSQGFRAPNLSDLTRFDIARSSEIEIPAADIDPERYITYELGFKSQNQKLASCISYYYTTIDQMITRTPTGRIRDGLVEVTKMNTGEGYIHGLELSETCFFSPQWSVWINASWQEGKVDIFPTSSASEKKRDYISRMMPPTAQLGVRWQTPNSKYWTELAGDIAQDADKLSDEDKLDTQRIPPGGTPGYAVLSFRTGFSFSKGFELAVSLENIFDKDYRIHGSGVNEPGRNLIITSNCTF